MTEENKHTPTPYEAEYNGYYWNIKQKDGLHSFASTSGCYDSHDDNLSNNEVESSTAEFIVRACNNHYELLEALELLVKDLDERAVDNCVAVGNTPYFTAQQAIKQAKGETK